MIRFAIGVLSLGFAAFLWRVSENFSLHTAWLLLLAWAAGAGISALLILDWIMGNEPQPKARWRPRQSTRCSSWATTTR